MSPWAALRCICACVWRGAPSRKVGRARERLQGHESKLNRRGDGLHAAPASGPPWWNSRGCCVAYAACMPVKIGCSPVPCTACSTRRHGASSMGDGRGRVRGPGGGTRAISGRGQDSVSEVCSRAW
ncbi:hypothetical protein RirG_031880 [Rhizophagus irregularis DAOM 197198w]|uniref:Uncharacterized protein n=1 Tax=Rhizophagus irregularis (strain DAOM 197198w) TaxID=1432141 RepID=A0A015KAH6_RHIIW|nr:hypothetical protein RirG_031880 [Rhizophagus irregularis DAOM 197198w]